MKHLTKVYWIILACYLVSMFLDYEPEMRTNLLLIGIFYYLFAIAKHLSKGGSANESE